MATYRNDVDAQREQARKADAYDERMAAEQQSMAAQQGLKFGVQQGYQQGMQDNDATSMQAYEQGAQDGAGAYASMTQGGNAVVDGGQVDPEAMDPALEFEEYRAQLNELVQTEQIGPEEARGMLMQKQKELGMAQQQRQQPSGSGGFGNVRGVNSQLTQQAAQYSMPQ